MRDASASVKAKEKVEREEKRTEKKTKQPKACFVGGLAITYHHLGRPKAAYRRQVKKGNGVLRRVREGVN